MIIKSRHHRECTVTFILMQEASCAIQKVLHIFFVYYLTMKIVDITKERLLNAQKDGYTVLITKFNSDPLYPTWIFEKIEKEKIESNKQKLNENYQLCYSIREAINTIDSRPFIGKLQLTN